MRNDRKIFMLDCLSNEERTLAWEASWNPSFAGIGIADADFTFRSVNHQFCDIVGVSPAELIGRRFQDMTPVEVRDIEEKNAILVMEGTIDSYLLPKSYEFTNGRKVDVILLVKGVYSGTGEFQFFLLRIMMDQENNTELHSTVHSKDHVKGSVGTNSIAQKSAHKHNLLAFIKEYGKMFVGIGTVLGAFIYTIIKGLEG